jgi:2'-5' RNA ligase
MIRQILEKLFAKGVYISLKPVNGSSVVFKKYIRDNVPELTPTPDPHLTLIYSKKKFDGTVKVQNYEATGTVKGFSIFGQNGDRALVAEIESKDIMDRNAKLVKDYGFISDFDEYKPHITLAYDVPEDFDVNSLPKFPQPLTFGEETVGEVELDWVKKNKD